MNTGQLIKEIIYKALANRDTTGTCRRPLESTVKGINEIERKVNEYQPIIFGYYGKHEEAIKY